MELRQRVANPPSLRVRHRSVPTSFCDGGPPGSPANSLIDELGEFVVPADIGDQRRHKAQPRGDRVNRVRPVALKATGEVEPGRHRSVAVDEPWDAFTCRWAAGLDRYEDPVDVDWSRPGWWLGVCDVRLETERIQDVEQGTAASFLDVTSE